MSKYQQFNCCKNISTPNILLYYRIQNHPEKEIDGKMQTKQDKARLAATAPPVSGLC